MKMTKEKEGSDSLSEKIKRELKEIGIKDILIIVAIILIFTTFYSKIDVAKNPCKYCQVCCNGVCKRADKFGINKQENLSNFSFELNKKRGNKWRTTTV